MSKFSLDLLSPSSVVLGFTQVNIQVRFHKNSSTNHIIEINILNYLFLNHLFHHSLNAITLSLTFTPFLWLSIFNSARWSLWSHLYPSLQSLFLDSLENFPCHIWNITISLKCSSWLSRFIKQLLKYTIGLLDIHFWRMHHPEQFDKNNKDGNTIKK